MPVSGAHTEREREGHRGAEGPVTGETSVSNRYLGSGQGQKLGGRIDTGTAAGSGTRRGVQILVAESDGWRVWATSRWTAHRAGRGGGEQV